MTKIEGRAFLVSGLYLFRHTFPYSTGEVVAEALMPIVKRLVFLVLLLGNFRYLSKHAEPGMSYPEMGTLLLPVFLSVFAVMTLPSMLELLKIVSARRLRRTASKATIQEYCRLLFGEDRVVEDWNLYYEGQRAVVVYLLFMLLLSPIFLYYSPNLFVVYITITILFGTVCTRRLQVSERLKIGRQFNSFTRSDAYLNTVRYAAFSVYIVACAIVIVMAPTRMPIEFLFVVIVGMRQQLARGKSVIGFFLWEGDKGQWTGNRDNSDASLDKPGEPDSGRTPPAAGQETGSRADGAGEQAAQSDKQKRRGN